MNATDEAIGTKDGAPPAARDDVAHATSTGGWRILHLALGSLAVVLATAGAFLPLLPTTPFLLLASYHFSRSSPKLDAALRRSRLFGPFLSDWHERGGVRTTVKWLATCVVLTAVAASLAWGPSSSVVRMILLSLASIGLIVVWRLPTARG